MTPKTLAAANNDKARAHVYELTAQRISRYAEPGYVGYDMMRGDDEEILARQEYTKHYARVTETGAILEQCTTAAGGSTRSWTTAAW